MLSQDAVNVYRFLSEWAYDTGVISASELRDRYKVLESLLSSDNSGIQKTWEFGTTSETVKPTEIIGDGEYSCAEADDASHSSEDPRELHLVPMSLPNWIFTKNDADDYPSTPHGHYNQKTRSWPKLNPYTGRVYSAKEKEDQRLRLSKRDMVLLWNDKDFRLFCLEHIAWYQGQYPHYRFRVRDPYRLPRWRFR